MWKYITGNIQNHFVLAGVGVVSVVLAAIEILTVPDMVGHVVIWALDLACCVFLAWQFFLDWRISRERPQYWKTHWVEIPALMPLLLLWLIQVELPASGNLIVIQVYQLIAVPFIIFRLMRCVSLLDRFIKERGLIYLVLVSFGFIFIGALVMLILEEGSGRSQITDFMNALWWSTAAITKVSYTDVAPVTPAGRILSMIWMVIGVVLMTGIISELSALLVAARMRRRETADMRNNMLEEIKAHVDHIDQMDEHEMKMLVDVLHALRQKNIDAKAEKGPARS